VGIYVDYDGTLAPIVDDPARAVPIPGAADLLRTLSERWGRLVVISGRPVAYLVANLAGAGSTELFGLYGLERARGDSAEVDTDAEAEEWRNLVDQAAVSAEKAAPPGVTVERKGLTVTLHYRQAPDQAGWVAETAGRLQAETGLAAHRGKMSVELRPPVAIDKGTVVRDLSVGLSAVLYAGDDLGDLPAFAELARLRKCGVETLGVASGGAETPPEVTAAADIVVDGPGGVADLLRRLSG
jgi:trehalose 6-phosphate phosphatase